MAQKVLAIAREQLRRELAADLGRGGYVLQVGDEQNAERYFEKALVLCRPGLLARAADLISDLLPEACERIAVNGVSACALGTALSLITGVPLLLGWSTAMGCTSRATSTARPRWSCSRTSSSPASVRSPARERWPSARRGAQRLVPSRS